MPKGRQGCIRRGGLPAGRQAPRPQSGRQQGLTRHGTARHDATQHGAARHAAARHGAAWHGVPLTSQGLCGATRVDQRLQRAVAHAQVVQAAAEDELVLATCQGQGQGQGGGGGGGVEGVVHAACREREARAEEALPVGQWLRAAQLQSPPQLLPRAVHRANRGLVLLVSNPRSGRPTHACMPFISRTKSQQQHPPQPPPHPTHPPPPPHPPPHTPPITPGWVSMTFRSKSTMSSGLQPSSLASRRSSSGWCRAPATPAAVAPLPLEAEASPAASPEPPSSFCLMLVASSGVHCVCGGGKGGKHRGGGGRGWDGEAWIWFSNRPEISGARTAQPAGVLLCRAPMLCTHCARLCCNQGDRAALLCAGHLAVRHHTGFSTLVIPGQCSLQPTCLFGLNPAVDRSRCRWMASIGMRRMGLGTCTCGGGWQSQAGGGTCTSRTFVHRARSAAAEERHG